MYGDNYDYCDFSDLSGKTITAIEGLKERSDEIHITCSDGSKYRMSHHQDCCESVDIEDVVGDVNNMLNSPVLLAEAVSSSDPSPEVQAKRDADKAEVEAGNGYYYSPESETWTFYKLSTLRGSLTIRWYGTSNGYYSESVSFEKEKA